MSVARKSAVPGEQRVFSLILALVASPQGRTKRELLSSVYGYAERYCHGDTDPALERQFERDKDHVRDLGIPIETLDSPEEPGNTQMLRYRIAKQAMLVPNELRFSPEEITVLRLASLAWAEGSLSAQSRRATMKLEALGAGIDTQHVGVAPSIGIIAAQAPALQRAIDEQREITFTYQLPERDTGLTRHVAPLHLHRADGRWHLIAWDSEREQHRVFLLSRIIGEVTLTKQRFDAARFAGVPAVLEELHELKRSQVARVQVRAGSTASARLAHRAVAVSQAEAPTGSEIWEIGVLDMALFCEEIASFGADALVLDPPELRARVSEVLQRTLAQHTTRIPSGGK